jgi:hypothetical protein
MLACLTMHYLQSKTVDVASMATHGWHAGLALAADVAMSAVVAKYDCHACPAWITGQANMASMAKQARQANGATETQSAEEGRRLVFRRIRNPRAVERDRRSTMPG